MRRAVPSLEDAEAFVAVARAPSLRAAAQNLALSPSAISRRVQSLETFLGVQLFTRTPTGMVLSHAGKRFLSEAEPAIEALRRATVLVRNGREPLRVGASHSFTAEWLLPRLPELLASCNLRVEPVVGDPVIALREGRVDVAFKGGREPPADLVCEPIGEGVAILVAARQLADGRTPPRSIDALDGYPRLAERRNPEIWAQWLHEDSDCENELPPTDTYDTLQMTYEAAASGFGVTLAFPLVAERFLKSGRLLPCFQSKRHITSRYWVMQNRRAPGTRAHPDRETFIAWMNRHVTGSVRYFDACAGADAN